MALEGPKESPLHGVLPQDDPYLLGVCQYVLIIGLRSEIFVEKTCPHVIRTHKRRCAYGRGANGPSADLRRFLSSSHSLIWSCTVTGRSGFCGYDVRE